MKTDSCLLKFGMKYLVLLLIFSSFLLGYLRAESIHDEACNKIQKQAVASCFDRSTLGFCMKVGDEWRAIEAATCEPRLCCNAKIMGCTMDADCKSELTTSSPLNSSTEKAAVDCSVGQLKKHESDCKKYYYCSNNSWKESACSAGVFDDSRMSCVFGSCNNSGTNE
ncbi:uncharacterized protein LOC129947787 [Eupeodes corollae]|uniref:uncharacterized protein LOC129947787 n=1 Tax=Eupeodes corollae TaxID=290404 RepID=UPI002490740E|nr:uncharacterized protein LOC129947787 [Eupeodes corollae]